MSARLLVALAIVLTGCGPALPDQVIEGRWVRYHYWADEGAPCPEAIAQMDRFVDLLSARTGRPAPSDFRIDYFRLRTLREVRELCPPLSDACAPGSRVYSLTTTQDHELTHAFLNRLGRPPSLFTEGIAVAFGCGATRWVGEPLPQLDVAALVDNEVWAAPKTESYQAAGGFVRELVDRHGLEAFLKFYAETPWGVSRAELNARFRRTFEEELDDALARWNSRAPQRDGEFCLPLEDRCDAPPDLTVGAGSLTAQNTLEVSCVEQVSTLEVTDAAVTRLRFIAEKEGRRLRLRPCSASGSPAQQLLYAYTNTGSTLAMQGRWNELWADLKPGRYSLTLDTFVTLNGVPPTGGSATVETSPAPPVFGGSCSVAPVMIGADTWTIAFLASAPPADSFVVLQPTGDRRVAGLFGAGFSGPVTLCNGCATPTGCQPIEAGETNFGSLKATGTSLRLAPDASAGATLLRLVLEAP